MNTKTINERIARIQQAYYTNQSNYKKHTKELQNIRKERKSISKMRKLALLALKIIQRVGTSTQKKTLVKVEGLVSAALRDVFLDERYDFKMEVSYTKRTMSVEFFFVRDGEYYTPLECCGYGCVDVACFALRVAIWSLNPTARTFFLDEPFRNVSEEYRERVGQLLRKISKELSFQFIISTHMKELFAYADVLFKLTKQPNNRTKIERSVLCAQFGS